MQAEKNLEKALQRLNENISLPENEVKRNNEILAKVVDLFITEMKKDSLFEELYERAFYGGSFYDELRAGFLNDFDMDILLRIPVRMSPTIDISNVPGFVFCKILNRPSDTNQTFLSMINEEGYIKATSVRDWMEDITSKTIQKLCPKGELKVLSQTLSIRTRNSGPAITVFLQQYRIALGIDFIPCFVFRQNEWPRGDYRPNPIPDKPEFFVVPKTPWRSNLPDKYEFLWRLSFQEQERKMIEDKQFLKPALKLLKRLRDKEGHYDIENYFIKTIFLWEVEANEEIFNRSLADSFVAILNKYIEWLEREDIPYFWNENNNLLVGVNPSTLKNYANCLKKIRRNMNSYIISAYMK